jgi:hypothetical protein
MVLRPLERRDVEQHRLPEAETNAAAETIGSDRRNARRQARKARKNKGFLRTSLLTARDIAHKLSLLARGTSLVHP